MPFNGSGTFSIINSFVPNTTILSAAVNANFTDIATGLSDCLTRDGQAGMTAIFKAISGSVSAPGITFNSDATAGLYLSGSGIVGLVAKSLGLLVDSQIFQAQSATVQAGGSNYAVGDTITTSGGTAVTEPVFTVATLTGSAVASVTVGYPGVVGVTPSNPVSQGSTSGSGTGCTLNVTWNNPSGSDYRTAILSEGGLLLWPHLGASSFVSGLMAKANGLDFANAIGGTNIANAIGSSFIFQPQGVLSPISSTTVPIPNSDQTGVTRIYWTPYNGNACPIFNGASFANTTSAQIFCDVTAGAQASGGIYDIYKFLNSGTVTLGFSPTWAAGTSGSVTAGSCARGTGTGGTALAVVGGVYVNAAAQTMNNGATTFSVAANQGTYLGSIYINSTAGQINCFTSYGQSRVWGLWNAFNRREIFVKAGDGTASWTYGLAAFRASNGNTANSFTSFCGLADTNIDLNGLQRILTSATGSAQVIATGLGVNSTTSLTGTQGTLTANINNVVGATLLSSYTLVPGVGINTITMIESAGGAAANETWFGTETNMLLSGKWMG